MIPNSLDKISEHELLARLVAMQDEQIVYSGQDVDAIERELWKRYMPVVAPTISDTDLLALGPVYLERCQNKASLFRAGKIPT